MTKLMTAKIILANLNDKILPVLEKAIAIIPNDKLEFKPNDKLNTIKQLAYHSLNGPYVYLKGVENTVLTQEIYDTFKLDLKDIHDTKVLIDYAHQLKTYINKFKENLTDNDLSKSVSYKIWEEWTQTGFEAILTSMEETIHHRGQLCTYLRLLGLNPPMIYSYL